MARGKRRPKPMSPKAGIKRTRYGLSILFT